MYGNFWLFDLSKFEDLKILKFPFLKHHTKERHFSANFAHLRLKVKSPNLFPFFFLYKQTISTHSLSIIPNNLTFFSQLKWTPNLSLSLSMPSPSSSSSSSCSPPFNSTPRDLSNTTLLRRFLQQRNFFMYTKLIQVRVTAALATDLPKRLSCFPIRQWRIFVIFYL